MCVWGGILGRCSTTASQPTQRLACSSHYVCHDTPLAQPGVVFACCAGCS